MRGLLIPTVLSLSGCLSSGPEAVREPVHQPTSVIPTSTGVEVNQERMILGNPRLVLSRTLNKTRLFSHLDCGYGPAGNNADIYRLELEKASRVVPLGEDRSRIDTEITGFGTNMEGTSNSRVLCTSKHRLELRIADAVRELVRP